MIRYDNISLSLIIMASAFSVYMFIFAQKAEWLFPATLACFGLVLGWFITKKFSVDQEISPSEAGNIFVHTVIALVGIGIGGFISGKLSTVPAFVHKLSLTPYDLTIYSILMAIAEEPFFRGFLSNLFLVKLPTFVALLLSAGVFGLYHMKVYGTSPEALSFALIAGLVLTYIAYKTQRITSGMFAHIINNVMDVIKQFLGGIIR